jgi:NADH-quinone oxidoreductase subunit H
VIPLGGEVTMFGVQTRLQVTDLPVGALVILAVASVAVYGFVLAGWSSQSSYALLGALRSSAQMISYEISMGLSYVAVFLYAGSMSTAQIVESQSQPLLPFGVDLGLQQWYWLMLLPSFVVYGISMVGETNRAPFDLPECESELVSGHLTEYSGFRYAIFFLAEYINMATVSAVMTTLFLGGYHAIWPFGLIIPDTGYWGMLWFVIKVQLLLFFFIWLRGTLPRVRYDQLMKLGWKVLIPVSLVWLMLVATVRTLRNENYGFADIALYVGGGVLALLLLSFVVDIFRDRGKAEQRAAAEPVAFDPMAGGFPVPPLPGQEAPAVPRRRPRRERELIVSGGPDTGSDGSLDGKEASDG